MWKSVSSRWRAALAATLLAALPACASAEDFPSKPIHILCGFNAGSGADLICRHFAGRLETLTKQTVLVDNKPGVTGGIAAQALTKAAPDGYTMLLSPASTAAGNYFLYRNRLFDPLKDFVPVTTLERSPFVIAVDPSRPFKTLADLTAFIKSKNGDARYGLGSSTALGATALYLSREGTTATPIPYKSIIEALGDLTAGELDFTLADTPIAVGQSKSGRIRLLAVTSADRSPALPDVPTLAESGLPGFDFTAWWGAYVPAGTPPEIVAKLEGWLNEAVASAETKKFLEEGGATAMPGSAKLLRTMLASEMDKWREIVRLAKIEPQ